MRELSYVLLFFGFLAGVSAALEPHPARIIVGVGCLVAATAMNLRASQVVCLGFGIVVAALCVGEFSTTRAVLVLFAVTIGITPLFWVVAGFLVGMFRIERRCSELCEQTDKSRWIQSEARELWAERLRLMDVIDGHEFCDHVGRQSNTFARWGGNRVLSRLPAFRRVRRLYANRDSNFRRTIDGLTEQIRDYQKTVEEHYGVGPCSSCNGSGGHRFRTTCRNCRGSGVEIRRSPRWLMAQYEASQTGVPAGVDGIPSMEAGCCLSCGGRGTVSVYVSCEACKGAGRIYLPAEGVEQVQRFANPKIARLRASVERFG